MQDWQKRVITERDDLAEKLKRLNAFLARPDHADTVSTDAALDLAAQAHWMTGYLEILNRRIAKF